jgi:hypothetical protein
VTRAAQPAVGTWQGVPVTLTLGPRVLAALPAVGTWQAVEVQIIGGTVYLVVRFINFTLGRSELTAVELSRAELLNVSLENLI